MREPAYWQWIGRSADIAGVVTGIVAPLVVAATAVVKKRQLVHAAGWDIAWLCAVCVLVAVGASLLVVGIHGRRDIMRHYASNRGRDSTVKMLTGGALLLLAAIGLLTF